MRLFLALSFALFIAMPFAEGRLSAQEQPYLDVPRKIEHTVKPDEQLHLLAAYHLLDPRRWQEILTWNRGIISNKNLLYPGQVLDIWVDPDWEPPFDLESYLEEYRQLSKKG